jgi:hypothetical protein
MHQLDMGIAAKPRESGRGLDATKQREIELAEQGPARDGHGATSGMQRAAAGPADLLAEPRVLGTFLAFFSSTLRSLCFLE